MQIRKISEKDIPAIIALMREFAEYEKLLEYLEVTEEKLREAMFGENSFVEGLIALDGETAVGYALFFSYFSSFRAQRSIYLEDLYVAEKYRQHRIGEQMMREVARIGKEQGCVRMDFQVFDWNTPAIKFYKKHGAVMDESERHFKFTDEAFQKLAA